MGGGLGTFLAGHAIDHYGFLANAADIRDALCPDLATLLRRAILEEIGRCERYCLEARRIAERPWS